MHAGTKSGEGRERDLGVTHVRIICSHGRVIPLLRSQRLDSARRELDQTKRKFDSVLNDEARYCTCIARDFVCDIVRPVPVLHRSAILVDVPQSEERACRVEAAGALQHTCNMQHPCTAQRHSLQDRGVCEPFTDATAWTLVCLCVCVCVCVMRGGGGFGGVCVCVCACACACLPAPEEAHNKA